MPRLPLISWKLKERLYREKGYVFRRQIGSHRSYVHLDNPENIKILIAVKEIPRGTLRENINELGVSRPEFMKWYNKNR